MLPRILALALLIVPALPAQAFDLVFPYTLAPNHIFRVDLLNRKFNDTRMSHHELFLAALAEFNNATPRAEWNLAGASTSLDRPCSPGSTGNHIANGVAIADTGNACGATRKFWARPSPLEPKTNTAAARSSNPLTRLDDLAINAVEMPFPTEARQLRGNPKLRQGAITYHDAFADNRNTPSAQFFHASLTAIGHNIGLNHSSIAASIMRPTNRVRKRLDHDTRCALYFLRLDAGSGTLCSSYLSGGVIHDNRNAAHRRAVAESGGHPPYFFGYLSTDLGFTNHNDRGEAGKPNPIHPDTPFDVFGTIVISPAHWNKPGAFHVLAWAPKSNQTIDGSEGAFAQSAPAGSPGHHLYALGGTTISGEDDTEHGNSGWTLIDTTGDDIEIPTAGSLPIEAGAPINHGQPRYSFDFPIIGFNALDPDSYSEDETFDLREPVPDEEDGGRGAAGAGDDEEEEENTCHALGIATGTIEFFIGYSLTETPGVIHHSGRGIPVHCAY